MRWEEELLLIHVQIFIVAQQQVQVLRRTTYEAFP